MVSDERAAVPKAQTGLGLRNQRPQQAQHCDPMEVSRAEIGARRIRSTCTCSDFLFHFGLVEFGAFASVLLKAIGCARVCPFRVKMGFYLNVYIVTFSAIDYHFLFFYYDKLVLHNTNTKQLIDRLQCLAHQQSISVSDIMAWYLAKTNTCAFFAQYSEEFYASANKRIVSIFTVNLLHVGLLHQAILDPCADNDLVSVLWLYPQHQ